MMKIEVFSLGILGANCYLVGNEETKEVVLIDPGACTKKLVNHIAEEGLTPKAVLLTHGHFDHIMGVDQLVELYGIPVYAYELEREIIADPSLNLSSTYTRGYTTGVVQYFGKNAVLQIAGFDFEVIETPGHTVGGCCYYVEKEQALFLGDTLFHASIGRSDLPTGSEAALVRSIREKLIGLPDETVVYPGHMSLSTIGDEKQINPYI